MDEPSTFGISLPFSFVGRTVCISRHFGVKASSKGVHICDCPFPKEKKLYKLELNPDAIQLIL
jgi:hypothetical protein